MRFVTHMFLLLSLFFSATACQAAPTAEKMTTQYDALKRFTSAYDQVRNSYVRETTNDELLNNAIKGMLQGLDPHSTFLNQADYKEMIETTQGEFFGIGIEISTESNQIIVVSPIEDTPAYKAGVLAGDLILAVDGQSTQDMSLQEVVGKIRGTKGSAVELLILHKNASVPEPISIVRDTIPLVSVKARFLDEDGFLWVRVTRFSNKTTEELDKALAEVAKKKDIKGIVLDLRNNPGGLLKESVTVADRFLKKGVVVSMKGRDDDNKEEFEAASSKNDITCPVVVLVNSGSASAAEIVAGALQDHKRALVMGERSFGKGSVQNIIPIGDGMAIKITIALYYTPNGRSIQAEGIVPDIEIPFEVAKEEDNKLSRFIHTREKDLSGHLDKNATVDASNKTDKKIVEKENSLLEDAVVTQLAKDNQLRLALQMVRTLPKMAEISAK